MIKEYWGLSFPIIFIALFYNNVEARLMYIGAETNNLYLCHFDEVFGGMTLITTYNFTNPSCIFDKQEKKKLTKQKKKKNIHSIIILYIYVVLAFHPSKEYMYAVNEVTSFGNQNNTGLFYKKILFLFLLSRK